jgi:hypothetical protein
MRSFLDGNPAGGRIVDNAVVPAIEDHLYLHPAGKFTARPTSLTWS